METRPAPGKVWFFYRHPLEGPRFLRVKELASPSVLHWFQDMGRTAPRGDRNATHAWVVSQLGGRVYGLADLIEPGVPVAASMAELQRLLDEHQYREGTPDGKVIGEQSVCVKTDDDDHDIVYCFVADELVRKRPERFAWWIWGDRPLPAAAATKGAFEPLVPVRSLAPRGGGDGRTFVVSIEVHETGWLDAMDVAVLEGGRVPDLTRWLRDVVPVRSERTVRTGSLAMVVPSQWPGRFLQLRALLHADDTAIGPALQRLRNVPQPADLVWSRIGSDRLMAPWPQASATADSAFAKERGSPRAGSIAEDGPHHAMLLDDGQLFVFDDLWATANPDLAQSILAWGSHWNPMHEFDGKRR